MESPFSLSAGKLNLALLNLFFAFLDALRNSSLFATYPVPLVLLDRSGGKESVFSEYVLFNPPPTAAPSRVMSAELAERGNSFAPLCRLDKRSNASTECRELSALTGATGSTLTSASVENIALQPAVSPGKASEGYRAMSTGRLSRGKVLRSRTLGFDKFAV